MSGTAWPRIAATDNASWSNCWDNHNEPRPTSTACRPRAMRASTWLAAVACSAPAGSTTPIEPASGALATSSSRDVSAMMLLTYRMIRLLKGHGGVPSRSASNRASLVRYRPRDPGVPHYRIVRLPYRGFAVPTRRFEDGRARQATRVRRGGSPRHRDAAVLGPRLRWHVDERAHRGDGYQPAQHLRRVRQQGGAVHRGVGTLPGRPRSVRGEGAGAPDRPGSCGGLPSRLRGGVHVIGPSVRVHGGAVRADLQRRGSGRLFRPRGPAGGRGRRLP